MQRRDFPEQPATMLVEHVPGETTTYLVESAWIEHNLDGFEELVYRGGGVVRELPIGEMRVDVIGRWEFTTAPNGVKVVVRPYEEDDAVASPQLNSRIPLPRDLVAAALRGYSVKTEIEALVDDDGYVRTLLLVNDAGLYVRYAGAWHPVTDESQIDGFNSVPVLDSAIDLYDPFDQAGQLVSINSMPTTQPTEAEPPAGGTATAVTAAAVADAMIEIETARDVPRAVEIAEKVPKYRWYVERRVRALGVPIALPWVEPERARFEGNIDASVQSVQDLADAVDGIETDGRAQ